MAAFLVLDVHQEDILNSSPNLPLMGFVFIEATVRQCHEASKIIGLTRSISQQKQQIAKARTSALMSAVGVSVGCLV
jgi:hypothetical protein